MSMQVSSINPFIESAIRVLHMVLGQKPSRGDLSARPQLFTTQQINIVCGFTGDLEGQVIYGMSNTAAVKIASTMLQTSMVIFDNLSASAIAELGNMISGHSAALLSEAGVNVTITPPFILRGSSVQISTNPITSIVIPLHLDDYGLIEINVGVKEKTSARIA
jgi:chemotaxis protein CheX